MNHQKILWMDQRHLSSCLVKGTLLVFLLSWVLVSVAIAQSLPAKAGDPVQVSDLVRFQWWAISGLLGLIGVLGGFIIVREQNSMKSSVRELWKEKLSIEEHNKLDHSLLCAVCRNKQIGSGQ